MINLRHPQSLHPHEYFSKTVTITLTIIHKFTNFGHEDHCLILKLNQNYTQIIKIVLVWLALTSQ